MKKQPHSEPESQATFNQSSAGRIQATLNFQLPEAEELLELALQAQRWRGVVQDLATVLLTWLREAKTPPEAHAYRSVNMLLRDFLAETELTLETHEQLRSIRAERRMRHAKYFHAEIEAATSTWRDLMKSGGPPDPDDHLAEEH